MRPFLTSAPAALGSLASLLSGASPWLTLAALAAALVLPLADRALMWWQARPTVRMDRIAQQTLAEIADPKERLEAYLRVRQTRGDAPPAEPLPTSAAEPEP